MKVIDDQAIKLGREAERRRGARALHLVPIKVLADLNRGRCESVNLMEWLAIDMHALARHVFADRTIVPWGTQVLERIPDLREQGITRRLSVIGEAICDVIERSDHLVLTYLSRHKSDIVRQWAVYAVNALSNIELRQRLEVTRPFAADSNMSVRECAWMAFRPHLARNVSAGLEQLIGWALDPNPNIRRFAIEVSRPRSVWGQHIPILKSDPGLALPLLSAVKSDGSSYVRIALGNWLHDAWKSSPGWVESLCLDWSRSATEYTRWVVRRALRTKYRRETERR